ncbi:MAG: hypothetical protein O2868_10750 [Proteobacteria bacterium]|nr:hypothetical protein [Pseudomonadota bacterium]
MSTIKTVFGATLIVRFQQTGVISRLHAVTVAALLLVSVGAYSLPVHIRVDDRPLLEVIQSALINQEPMESIVTRLIAGSPEYSAEIIEAAVALSPGSVRSVVNAALSAGADASAVASQCRTSLTLPQVKAVVGSAMAARADVETILSACLNSRPIEYAADLLAAALTEASPDLYDEIIAVGFSIIEATGSDGRALLVESVMQGQILSGDAFGQDPGLVQDYVNDVVTHARRSKRSVSPPVLGREPASSAS